MTDLVNEYMEYERLNGFKESTIRDKLRVIHGFMKILNRPVLTAAREEIELYLSGVKTSGAYNARLYILRRFFDYLHGRGLVLLNPASAVRGMSYERGIPDIFTESEIKALIRTTYGGSLTGIRDRAIIELFYSTGIRVSELCGLDVSDIDFRDMEIVIIKGKYGRERLVPAGYGALKAVSLYLEERGNHDCRALFLSIRGARICVKTVLDMIYKRKRRAGILSGGGAHGFRRSFASHMLKGGAGIHVIQRILGHERISTTERYIAVDHYALRESYDESHPRA